MTASLEWVSQQRPQLCFLENVVAIQDVDSTTGQSNADHIHKVMRNMGYWTFSTTYDARAHGSPQRRSRWWCACLKMTDGAALSQELRSGCLLVIRIRIESRPLRY